MVSRKREYISNYTVSYINRPYLLTPWCRVLLEQLTGLQRQEIPRISRNPKAHYRTHKRPPPVSILGQPNSVHIPTSHLLEIRPNIIHPSTPRSPQVVSFPPVSPARPYTPRSPQPYATLIQKYLTTSSKRRESAATRSLGSRIRIPTDGSMDVCLL